MSEEIILVQDKNQLIESVRRFMKNPKYWRNAVGNHPIYIVHYHEGESHLFGLSKFCAFRNITLEDYVDKKVRFEQGGGTTQRHIQDITKQSWIPIDKIDKIIRYELEKWFSSFFPTYDINRLKIISLQ